MEGMDAAQKPDLAQTLESEIPSVKILGLSVHRVTMVQALDILDRFVKSGQPHFVITADASGAVQAQSDSEFRALFDRADLITPDSAGILWASKRYGQPLSERVSGVDIVDHICRASATGGYRIYFLGAAPGVAKSAADAMRQKYPGCQIVGTRDGYFKPEEEAGIANEIAALKPDFLFVAMGIPRQEKFILSTQSVIRAGVAMGVGGTFDVFSGNVKRAPKPMQNLRLEWLWRLGQNPQKIDKVKLLPEFVRLILKATK
jgi:N-acetylglucosaminyldiphosphoundecaprenol N-acetyl-beta-D-mannosaminyltransferase